MVKVVANSCYGGFGLSHEAILRLAQLKGLEIVAVQDEPWKQWLYYRNGRIQPDHIWSYEDDLARDDPDLVSVVEELGDRANTGFSRLRVAEIPDGIKWYIDDYDGIETIREEHRTW